MCVWGASCCEALIIIRTDWAPLKLNHDFQGQRGGWLKITMPQHYIQGDKTGNNESSANFLLRKLALNPLFYHKSEWFDRLWQLIKNRLKPDLNQVFWVWNATKATECTHNHFGSPAPPLNFGSIIWRSNIVLWPVVRNGNCIGRKRKNTIKQPQSSMVVMAKK